MSPKVLPSIFPRPTDISIDLMDEVCIQGIAVVFTHQYILESNRQLQLLE
jgi:hypothetical protein